MKKILLLSIVASFALSCSKDALETFPGDKVPSDVVYGSVENARSALTGALAGLGQGGWQGNYNSGIGFGLTETYLTGDALAEDYVLSGSGSGWMWQTYSYNVKSWFDDPRLQCSTTWNCYYTTINSCNNQIGSAELLETSAEGKNILGQAYVLRAFCYHMLAQVYARAYYYYPDDLCVPLYLEPTTSETKGAARSTNKQVYEEVIYPDLTTGVGLLEEAAAAGIARSSKTEIDYYVANGIKARVALTMHKWSDAYKAAEEALKGYAGSEALDASQITGGMNDITALPSVMWGEVKTTDNYGMYLSFQAQMDAGHDGYAKTARRCCTSWLWNRMNATDARRAWWLGTFDNADFADSGEAIRYCQEGNDPQARIYLQKLMAKRDASYTGAEKSGNAINGLTPGSDGASMTGSLLEEILIQRRLELWGEYGRIFDIKRLGQGFKRVAVESADNPQFDPASLIADHDTQSPGSFAWILLLPQKELDGNPNIVQNPIGDTAD